MSKVMEIIKEEQSKSGGRVTKNQELHTKLLIAVLTDNEYVAKDLKEITESGEVIIEEKKLAGGFKEIIVAAYKKAGMSDAEARAEVDNFKVTKDMAKAIVEAVREADYLMVKECKKKIQLFKKPAFEFNLSVAQAKESVRKNRNPKDPDKKVISETTIHAREKIRVEHVLHPFQKTEKKLK